ncbi:MAG: VCBS repeat-containing protein [Planctomycetes bacterium]|nr:VCBS repeat-containing protein [Planctomycetota bacterium]
MAARTRSCVAPVRHPLRSTPALTLLFGAIVAGAAPPASAQIQFDAVRHFEAVEEGDVGPIVVADFDRDGSPDVLAFAVAHHPSFQPVAVTLTRDGTGQWRRASTLTELGNEVRAAFAGQVDGDGFIDIVAGDPLRVFRGDGRGGFAAAAPISGANGFFQFVLADLNRDGFDDVVTNETDESLRIFYADGLGGFTSTVMGGSGAGAPAVADLDRDGWPDVVLPLDGGCGFGCDPGGLAVLLGRGDGTLRAAEDRVMALEVLEVVTGDFDRDANPDVALLANPAQVWWARGDGHGAFAAPSRVAFFSGATQLTVADVDADGNPDLVVLTARGADLTGNLTWMRGNGNGTFAAPRSIPVTSTFPVSGAYTLADVNQDGLPEALIAAESGFAVHSNVPGTGFVSTPTVGAGVEPSALRLADFDEDGLADALTSSRRPSAPTPAFLIADGIGSFSPSTAPVPSNPRSRAVGDLSGDGHADLIVQAEDMSDRLDVFFGSGDGSFGIGPSVFTGIFPRSRAQRGRMYDAVELVDVDADGTMEILVSGAQGARIVRDVLSPSITLGPLFTPLPTWGALTPADLDGDSRPELVAVEHETQRFIGPSRLAVWRGDGAFGFVLADGPFELPYGANAPAIADVDGDGIVDVVVAAESNCCDPIRGGVFVLRGNGDGTLQPPAPVHVGTGFSQVVAADFDRDGRIDLAASRRGETVVLQGDGLGGFSLASTWTSPNEPAALVAADVEGDGDPDVLVLDAWGYAVWILRNRAIEAHLEARRGNVNAAAGSVTDVLFVNGSAGDSASRSLVVDRTQPFEIRVDAPPALAGAIAPFVMWDWVAVPGPETLTRLPARTGRIAMPTPLSRSRSPQPRLVANNLGHARALGVENWPRGPSRPAPSVLLSLPRGLPRAATFYLQGLVVDPASANGTVAVTNGILVVAR